MGETFLEVHVTVEPSPSELFAVLVDPAKHVEADGSGMLMLAQGSGQITGVGQTFTMSMRAEDGRAYEVANHVVEFEADRHIAWTPARVGARPVGVKWEWFLEPSGAGTAVRQRCDWSAVTDAEYLARRPLPRVSADKMRATVLRIAELAA